MSTRMRLNLQNYKKYTYNLPDTAELAKTVALQSTPVYLTIETFQREIRHLMFHH